MRVLGLEQIEQIYDSMLDSLSENIEFFKVPVRFDRLTPDAKFALKEYEDWAKKLPGLCRVSRSSRPSQARRPRTSGCATPGSAQRWGVMDGVPVAAACLPKRALSGSGKGAAAQAAGDVHVCERPVRKSAGRERRRLRARLVFLKTPVSDRAAPQKPATGVRICAAHAGAGAVVDVRYCVRLLEQLGCGVLKYNAVYQALEASQLFKKLRDAHGGAGGTLSRRRCACARARPH